MPEGRPELTDLVGGASQELASVHAAREAGLAACRQTIRAAGSAIRAVHRRQPDKVAGHIAACEAALRDAQQALGPFPAAAYSGFLHDAEKEYAEAVLTRDLIGGGELPGPHALGVQVPAWLNGLVEAASELRRQILDLLRQGDSRSAESLLAAMEDVYEAVVLVDYPDAVTGGLRRSADSLRAVLERTRSDLTTTLLQFRLQAALERRAPGEDGGAGALA